MKNTFLKKILQYNHLEKLANELSGRTFRDMLSDWRWILTYTKRRRWEVVLYTAVGILTSSFGVTSAYLVSELINTITERQLEKLTLNVILVAVTSLLSILLVSLKSRLSAKIELEIVKDIQTDLFCNIVDLRWTELRKYKNGDLLNRFNQDMMTIMDGAISWIPNVIINLYTAAITIFVLFRMDPVMAWIGIGSAPVLILLSRFILRRQKHYREKVLQIDSDMYSFETESFYNMDTIKAFGVWDTLTEQLSELQKKYHLFNMDYTMFQVKTNVGLSLLSNGVAFLSLAYCLFRLWTGGIQFGDMTFFLTQRNSLTSLFGALLVTLPSMLNASVSAHRLREFVKLEREEHNFDSYQTLQTVSDNGLTIEIKNLTFAYSDSFSDGETVYENANFTASPGDVIAILGESGGGKTTLFRLLLGLVIPDEGKVIIRDSMGDEVDMNADLRRFISYVPQGNTMMLGTIADNLRLMKKDATDDEIIEALKIACAWEFVEPLGINAMLGERGKGISEGQAQRLSIARAVLRDAPILLLDEATSALDEATESKIIDNVIKATPNKTIIISTHRPSLLKKCKSVYRLGDKTIELTRDKK